MGLDAHQNLWVGKQVRGLSSLAPLQFEHGISGGFERQLIASVFCKIGEHERMLKNSFQIQYLLFVVVP